MLQLDKSISKPFYVQIYEYYRQEIESSRMVAGMRLDSVRELAQAAGISKMTVEKALLPIGQRRLYPAPSQSPL